MQHIIPSYHLTIQCYQHYSKNKNAVLRIKLKLQRSSLISLKLECLKLARYRITILVPKSSQQRRIKLSSSHFGKLIFASKLCILYESTSAVFCWYGYNISWYFTTIIVLCHILDNLNSITKLHSGSTAVNLQFCRKVKVL